MTAIGKQFEELADLVWALANDRLDADGAARLGELLEQDADNRRVYIELIDQFATLEWEKSVSGQQPGTSGQGGARGAGRGTWESGATVEGGEWRVENAAEYAECPHSRIPDVPAFDLQISKSPNLQIPTRHSPLATLNSAWAFSYSVATVFLAVMLLGAWSYTITHPAADALTMKNSQRATPSARVEKAPAQFTFVGIVSGMVDCQWADESTVTYPGAAVALNRRYALKSGLMELTYDSGAKVILQGPCEYTVESVCGGYLKVGKLTALVGEGPGARGQGSGAGGRGSQTNLPSPFGRGAGGEGKQPHPQSALTLTLSQRERGRTLSPTPLAARHSPLFAVRTPTALVEDLGTEFGVEVGVTGETVSHVFEGQVRMRIEGAGDGGREAGDEVSESPNRQISKSEILLTAGQSARVERDGNQASRIVREYNNSVAAGFVQQMPRRVPIELFNTGIGLKEGDADPHWRIVARSDQPDFMPVAAAVTTVTPDWLRNVWLPNDAKEAQWISTAGDLPDLPGDETFTFRTTFVLTDFVPGSASLRGKFIADDYVAAVRLNGIPVSVPAPEAQHDSGGLPFERFAEFVADAGFCEGENTLEIDVRNGRPGRLDPPTPMLLLVKLQGYYTQQRGRTETGAKANAAENAKTPENAEKHGPSTRKEDDAGK
jgi:hypothetical protein